ncbi:MAG: hypothetical protein KY439_00060 [Actinobacteria bacterium]|nr:hypothetical protein [Actinomycetota bacterium]
MTVLLVVSLVLLWVGSTLLLSCLPWFQRRELVDERRQSQSQSHEPDWVNDVEGWLASQ